ncbi:hypothetical protein OAM01_02700, partial [bacterium]|nr:hypothetical protein [bacterium]
MGWFKSSFIIAMFLMVTLLNAVPLTFQYQGHIIVDGVAFEGTGEFKFAFLDDSGSTVWSHDGTSENGSEPSDSITLEMERGVYTVELGSTDIVNMDAIPASVFDNEELYLRVWFDDVVNGSQLLEPDTRVASVAFSVRAESAARADVADTVDSLPDGLIDDRHFQADLLADIATLRSVVENLVVYSDNAEDEDLQNEGFSSFHTLTESSWENGSDDGQPTKRFRHSSVWVDGEWMIWGGMNTGFRPLQTGGIYNVVDDAWVPISMLDVPSSRWGASLVWTGEVVLAWGGFSEDGFVTDGHSYNLETQFWRSLSSVNVPEARVLQVSTWTGSTMAIWGGRSASGWTEQGAVYDPSNDEWTTLDLSVLPLIDDQVGIDAPSPRSGAVGVWTGSDWILFGGQLGGDKIHNGLQIQFDNGQAFAWTPLSEVDAPSTLSGHSVVWTGDSMIVWGGSNGGQVDGSGAIYDPATDAWTPVSSDNAPSARKDHAAVWTGQEMLIIGGSDGAEDLADGYAYDPSKDSWRALTQSGDPIARSQAEA